MAVSSTIEEQPNNPQNAAKCQPQPTVTHIIKGTTPGVLDPTQPSRVLRHPSHKLSFASFDPLTATAQSEVTDTHKSSINKERCRPKRVVVESAASGENFWRFVPNAKKEPGCEDEGQWPRVLVLCGELVECSLEQWEIYKLDPQYECLVRRPPERSVISHVRGSGAHSRRAAPSTTAPKRSRISPPRTTSPAHTKRRRMHHTSSDPNGTDDMEYMDVDESLPSTSKDPPPTQPRAQSAAPSYTRVRAKLRRDEIVKERQLRKEGRNARLAERYGRNGVGHRFRDEDVRMEDDMPTDGNRYSRSVPPESPGKRRAPNFLDSLNPDHNRADGTSHFPFKRARHDSPRATQRWLNGKRMAREKKRAEIMERMESRRRAMEDDVLRTCFEEYAAVDEHDKSDGYRRRAASADPQEEQSTQPADPSQIVEDDRTTEEIDEEDARRRAKIAASIAKLADLERDRPLWEERARKRQEAEAAEEEARRIKMEKIRMEKAQQAEAERLAQARKKEMEERERAEAARREREEAARRKEERRHRESRWSSGTWTTLRALERYKTLSDAFDVTKFSAADPLTFADVPWPVLHSPTWLTVEDVGWTAVEHFFEEVKPHMRMQDYKVFVEKSHRRFHPDRWRSRGLLSSVKDDVERGCLEVAANTVVQALTPLWTELRAR